MLDWYREPFSTQATDTDSEPFRPPSDSKASWANGSMPKKQDVMSEPYEESAPLPSLPPASELSGLPESLKSSKPFDPSNSSASLDILRPAESPPLSERRESNYDDPSATKLLEILDKDDCTHVAAFQAYSELRYPGVWYLSDDSIRLLFRRLSVVEKKNKDSMLRYLSVVDDMKSSGFDMTQAEWNSAIAFCGQCFARISADDVETALRTWKEMEEEAKVKGGHVTFNILFDMAAKSGKFVLAEMILKEMETRKLRINRYARVGLIFYHGLKADGDGIRRAYREFVEAGEIVDTVVMNCVIASFMRAGEPSAADQVYERMKRMLSKYTGQTIPLLRWKETRDLGRILNRAAREFKDQPERLQQLRNEQLLAPNLRTYAIFVEHHASRTGELRRISTLLTEMSHLGIPIHGRIFLKIFKGFAFHGGLRYTSWTTARLESVWDALLVAVEETDVKVMRWTVVWAVRAFERCAGRERMFEVWGELRRRWKPGDWGELQMVMGLLRDCLDVDDFK